nr:spidroin-1-like [Aegilops tauschii subsp. strangulata]
MGRGGGAAAARQAGESAAEVRSRLAVPRGGRRRDGCGAEPDLTQTAETAPRGATAAEGEDATAREARHAAGHGCARRAGGGGLGRGAGGGGAEARGAAESGAEPRSRRVGDGSGKPDGAGRGASA